MPEQCNEWRSSSMYNGRVSAGDKALALYL